MRLVSESTNEFQKFKEESISQRRPPITSEVRWSVSNSREVDLDDLLSVSHVDSTHGGDGLYRARIDQWIRHVTGAR